MKNQAKLLCCVALISSLGGCANIQDNPKQTGGALLGGAAGALVGAQFGGGNGRLLSVAAGTLLGAFGGSVLGHHLDQSDHVEAEAAAQRALQSSQPTTWSNSNTGHAGGIEPGRYYNSKGRQCRKFTQKIYIDGKAKSAQGTACKENGQWHIVN